MAVPMLELYWSVLSDRPAARLQDWRMLVVKDLQHFPSPSP